MSKKPKLAFKVRGEPAFLWAADSYTRQFMAEQEQDALLWVTTHKPRSPRFHRAIHKLCGMLAFHCDAFSGLTQHAVLKRIQMEAGIELDVIVHAVEGYGMVTTKTPASISFDSMDETEFRKFSDMFCDYVATRYWPEFGLHLLNRVEDV